MVVWSHGSPASMRCCCSLDSTERAEPARCSALLRREGSAEPWGVPLAAPSCSSLPEVSQCYVTVVIPHHNFSSGEHPTEGRLGFGFQFIRQEVHVFGVDIIVDKTLSVKRSFCSLLSKVLFFGGLLMVNFKVHRK